METKIEYLDYTWNFLGGCSPVAAGCANCWACSLAAGRLKNHPLYKDLTKASKWTGEIRLCTDIGRSDILDQPLNMKTPRRIGVQFMGDLFHEAVPFEFIDRVFGVMMETPRHHYYILTKRPQRMAQWVKRFGENWDYFYKGRSHFEGIGNTVHLGVSCSTQVDADRLIPELLQIPAAVRFVSLEPLLGPVDILKYVWVRQKCVDNFTFAARKNGCGYTGASYEFNNPKKEGAYRCPQCGKNHTYLVTDSLDQVIVGGESGPGARPMHPGWVRGIRDQCVAAGVAFFFKQWGGVNKKKAGRVLDGKEWNQHINI